MRRTARDLARAGLDVDVFTLADLASTASGRQAPGVLCIDEHHDVDHPAILAAIATAPDATLVEIDGRAPDRRAA